MADFQEIEFNGEIIEFPVDMSDSDIAQVLQGGASPTAPSIQTADGLPTAEGDAPINTEAFPQAALEPLNAVQTAIDPTASFLGGAYKQAAFDTPEFIASGAGLAPNGVSDFFKQGGEEFQAGLERLGGRTKSLQQVGEAFGTGIGLGSVVAAPAAVVGKEVVKRMVGSGSRVKRTAGKLLDSIKSSPDRIVVAESLLAGEADVVSQVVEGVTDSSLLGTVAGITASVVSAPALYKQVNKSLSFDKLNRAEEVISADLRERFTPEQLQEFSNDINLSLQHGVQATLADATKDAKYINLTKDLGNALGDPTVATRFTEETVGAIQRVTDAVTDTRISAGEASSIVGDLKNQYIERIFQLDEAISSSLDGENATKASAAIFDLLDNIAARGKEATDVLYGKTSPMESLEAGKKEIIEAVSNVSKNAPVSAKAISAPVKTVKEVLIAEVKGHSEVAGVLDTAGELVKDKVASMTAGSLKTIRTMINDSVEAANIAGKKGQAAELAQLGSAITRVIDKHGSEELKTANKVYKEIEGFKAIKSIVGVFKRGKDGKIAAAPEQLTQKFLFGERPVTDTKVLLDFTESALGRLLGASKEDVVQVMDNAIKASIRASASGGRVTEENIKAFLSKGHNEELLGTLGVLDKYKNLAATAAEVNGLRLSKDAVDKMAFAKFGFSSEPRHIKNLLTSGRMGQEVDALNKLSGEVPRIEFDRLRATMLDNIMTGGTGEVRTDTRLLADLQKYGSKLTDAAHLSDLSFLASNLKKPLADRGQRLRQFDSLFRDLDTPAKIKGFLIARLGSTLWKSIRINDAGQEYFTRIGLKKDLKNLMLTPDGAQKLLKLAKKDPESSLFLRWAISTPTAIAGLTALDERGQQ